jgi:hypothetical protein
LPALRGSGILETMEICPSVTYASCDHIKTCDSSTQVSGWLSLVSRTGAARQPRAALLRHEARAGGAWLLRADGDIHVPTHALDLRSNHRGPRGHVGAWTATTIQSFLTSTSYGATLASRMGRFLERAACTV